MIGSTHHRSSAQEPLYAIDWHESKNVEKIIAGLDTTF